MYFNMLLTLVDLLSIFSSILILNITIIENTKNTIEINKQIL